MKLSQSGIGTMRVNNLDKMYPAQDILMQSGQLVQYSTGIFAYGNIVFLVKRKIQQIIEEELNKVGCIEVELPTLQPDEIWKKSGRLSKYIEEGVIITADTKKGTFCLAPTAEEAVVEFAREKLKSYKHMPATFYQIGEKYRDEIRNRGYLLRGKSFLMMDAYSFDTSLENLNITYNNIKEAYIRIGNRLGITICPVIADNGSIGGKKSEEMMLLSEIGEDTILYDENTKIALNTEILEKENYEEYLRDEYGITDISNLKPRKAIELGHIFQLGTSYSETMDAKFIDKDGKEKPYYMGCYGIGVSRLVAALYEKMVIKDENNTVTGISLSKEIAPYFIQIIPNLENEEKVKDAEKLYKKCFGKAILDDRTNISMGSKIKDAKILGTPFIAILGNKSDNGMFELEETATGKKQIVEIENFDIKNF
ncbi:MAG: hypothetical protein IJV31_02845 [Clostridia bacterium]|nr:hypothetical protein [Clostridia bacterium]